MGSFISEFIVVLSGSIDFSIFNNILVVFPNTSVLISLITVTSRSCILCCVLNYVLTLVAVIYFGNGLVSVYFLIRVVCFKL